MSLGDYANKLIGGHCYMKGLPSGEKRRVSIARELVMRPHILFIDEPLYHLDRYFSYFLICILLGVTVLPVTCYFLPVILNHN